MCITKIDLFSTGFTMYTTCVIWLSFIALYFGKYTSSLLFARACTGEKKMKIFQFLRCHSKSYNMKYFFLLTSNVFFFSCLLAQARRLMYLCVSRACPSQSVCQPASPLPVSFRQRFVHFQIDLYPRVK